MESVGLMKTVRDKGAEGEVGQEIAPILPMDVLLEFAEPPLLESILLPSAPPSISTVQQKQKQQHQQHQPPAAQ
ncbi:hypothetical protein ZHAS_00007286 [Anopheles sinensis]|uniref:Uncharacterized protein n=1 Tax=Anopheles sinensis TaxID=74873 RepID=A0A084VPL3_ANOSI|nr:hypothetical protein ZHAS_00007286 [Anopheles sinensis]